MNVVKFIEALEGIADAICRGTLALSIAIIFAALIIAFNKN